MDISQRGQSLTLSKNHNFYYRCFSLKLCHKRWLSDIYEEKNNFELEKIEVLKRVKNGHFLKGLVNLFSPKIEVFLIGVFHRNSLKKTKFLILWKEKNDFKWKKLKFQKGPENGHFSKGLVHEFCPKIKLFLIPVFHRNYVRKDLFWIF